MSSFRTRVVRSQDTRIFRVNTIHDMEAFHFFSRRSGLKEDNFNRIRRRSLGFHIPSDYHTRSSASLPNIKQEGVPSINVSRVEQERHPSPYFHEKRDFDTHDNGADDIKNVTSKFETLACSPLFAHWKITGHTPQKVC